MTTLNILLTEHEAAFVDKLISSGRYRNVEEVLEAGLRLLEQRATEAEQGSNLENLPSKGELSVGQEAKAPD